MVAKLRTDAQWKLWEMAAMRCGHCGEEFMGKPVKQDGEMFCSLECAYRAAGLEPEEEDDYYDEDPVEGAFEEEDE